MQHAQHGSSSRNVSMGLVATGTPLALRGFDPVAYRKAKAATPGVATHAAVYDGATYYFTNEENRHTFEADPAAYVLSFGGFCAYGVSVGKKFDGDPQVWEIVDERLHLNLNPEIKAAFMADVKDSIQKADDKWAMIADRAPASL